MLTPLKPLYIFCFLLFLLACKKEENSNTEPLVSLLSVTTLEVTNLTITSASAGGNIVYNGKGQISKRGVCWSINQFPTIKDFIDTSGIGTGIFNIQLKNLSSNKTYYLRAFAIDDNGIIYGNEIKFKTESFPSFIFSGQKIYAYPSDNVSSTWGSDSVITNAINYVDGRSNTKLLETKTEKYAAQICSNLNAFGYSDWYLPSRGELDAMLEKKGFLSMNATSYWSSTENSSTTAFSQNFQTGIISALNKMEIHMCRCVRKD